MVSLLFRSYIHSPLFGIQTVHDDVPGSRRHRIWSGRTTRWRRNTSSSSICCTGVNFWMLAASRKKMFFILWIGILRDWECQVLRMDYELTLVPSTRLVVCSPANSWPTYDRAELWHSFPWRSNIKSKTIRTFFLSSDDGLFWMFPKNKMTLDELSVPVIVFILFYFIFYFFIFRYNCTDYLLLFRRTSLL